jgi:hypothetical protein
MMKEAEVRTWSNAEAKHVNFQLKIQVNIIHIYTKYGDTLNVVRSMLKTISEAKDNKNNKREA